MTRGFVRALDEAGYEEIARAIRDASGDRLDDPDGDTFYSLVTHHGSRGLGAQVFARGHKAAMRETGKIADGIPDAAAWLDATTPEGQDYWEALQYVSRWTKANHESIHARFLERSGAIPVTAFGNEHNFVWKRGETYLHGKGATPAWKDEAGRPLLGLIPLNMAAPILVTLGRDNREFLSFAPHGAGRNQSRTATMREFHKANGDTDEKAVERAVAAATKGLDIRWYYGKPDLSESRLQTRRPGEGADRAIRARRHRRRDHPARLHHGRGFRSSAVDAEEGRTDAETITPDRAPRRSTERPAEDPEVGGRGGVVREVSNQNRYSRLFAFHW